MHGDTAANRIPEFAYGFELDRDFGHAPATRQGANRAHRVSGAGSSNPFPSSGESIANPTFSTRTNPVSGFAVDCRLCRSARRIARAGAALEAVPGPSI